MTSVKSNFIWNSAYQVVRIATPLVTTPYLTRVLGSEALGTYSYTYTIALYFTYFVLLGLNQYGNREVAKARKDKAQLSRTFWSIYGGQLGSGCLVFTAYLAFSFAQPGSIELYFLIWSAWVLAEIADISWLFYGLEEFRTITIRNVLIRVGVVVGIFIFVKSPADLYLYCALQSVSFVANSTVLWPLALKRITFCRVNARDILAHIKPSLILFVPAIAITCYTQLNKIFLGGFSGMSQVAFYDNADKIVTVPLAFVSSLGMVLLPRMSNVLAVGDDERAKAYLSESFWISAAMSCGLVFGIVGVSREFVPLFFGEGFEECETLLPLLSLIIPACAVSGVVGSQYLIPSEKDSLYLKSVLFGAIVNVVICLTLIPNFAAVGAAIATVAAECVVAGAQIWYARHELPLKSYFKRVVPFLPIGILEFFCIRAIPLTGISGWTLLLLEIVTGISVFAIASLVYLVAKGDEGLRLFGLTRFIKHSER